MWEPVGKLRASPARYVTPMHRCARAVARIVILAVFGAGLIGCGQSADSTASREKGTAPTAPRSEPSVELSPSQLGSIKIESVGSYLFPVEKEAVGSIDFDNDLSVQVFPPSQGKVITTFAELGDRIQKGRPLYAVESPDLIQAEATLLGAAASFEATSKELARARDLYASNGGVSQREVEQAASDQQTAEGALKAARDAVRVFGKTEDEINQIIASRKIDPALVVRSPISGEVTTKNAPPGLWVQPGNGPAPYAIADVSTKWMLANVIESDSPLFRVGHPVEVRVMAYPDRVFAGKVSRIYATVDPSTHRVTIRSKIADPKNELRPGMLANFIIRVQDPREATAIPVNGVVREADGTMTAWVTLDRHRFVQRVVRPGQRRDGRVQILDGLQRGELVVTDGGVFLSNMLQAPAKE